MKEKVDDALKQHFRPEFLNRIDETIVFHELSKDEVTEIVDLMIKRVQRQLEGQGLGLELTQEAKYFLADRGYDPTLGARPLRRAIQRLIEDPLSERLLCKEFRAGEIVVVDAERRSRDRREAHRVPHGRGLRRPRRWSWPRPGPTERPPATGAGGHESTVGRLSGRPTVASGHER